MTFSYTDDAIVSTSPTGRHLSSVIRRPVVLMSGWNEHAEEICKVLNDLQPDHPVSNLGVKPPREWLYCKQPRDKELDEAVLKLYPDGPTAHDIRRELASAKNQKPQFSHAEHRAMAEEIENLRQFCCGGAEVKRAELSAADGLQTLKEWQDYGHKIYAYAIAQGKVRDALTAELSEAKASLARAQEILKAPVGVDARAAYELYNMVPGEHVQCGGTTFKKV